MSKIGHSSKSPFTSLTKLHFNKEQIIIVANMGNLGKIVKMKENNKIFKYSKRKHQASHWRSLELEDTSLFVASSST